MNRSTICALALVACCPTDSIVDDERATHEIEPPTFADAAIAVLRSAFENELGVEMPEVVVRWFDAPMPYGDGVATGLHASCGDIEVYLDPRKADRAPYVLAHEVGHCAHRVLDGDSDHDHRDASFWQPSGIVDRAHLAVRDAGL